MLLFSFYIFVVFILRKFFLYIFNIYKFQFSIFIIFYSVVF
nr:MAG TPA: hypothetical protein [Crassvirales sp.]